MKRALVLCLLVLGFSVAALASPLTGSWSTTIRFDDVGGVLAINKLESIVDIDYTMSGWTFGTTAVFSESDFDNLFFQADGALGAFSFHSMLDFVPTTPMFHTWTNGVSVSLAGVDAFALFQVDNMGTAETPLIGSGATIGLQAMAGDIKVTGAAYFNMTNNTYYYWAYGYDWMVARDAYQSSCGTFGSWSTPSALPWEVQTKGCTLAWSGASIYVDFPFTCLTATAFVDFSCAKGFDGFGINLTGIETGIPWLTLEELDISFTLTTKTVVNYFGISFGDFVCVKPYITLVGKGATVIDGISLNALLLSYSFNGVTFKAGEIFTNEWYYWALNGGTHVYGFSKTGDITWSCIYNSAYDEYFGVQLDGDSCCGGAFKVGVYAFFDTSVTTSIFAWQELLASVNVGIGANTNLFFGVSFLNTGLNYFDLGVKFSW